MPSVNETLFGINQEFETVDSSQWIETASALKGCILQSDTPVHRDKGLLKYIAAVLKSNR